MIHTKDHTTGCLFDPWAHLGPKRRKLMQESWAGLFRDHILCELPVHTLAPAFSADFGRPTKELYTVLGVPILQQMKDLSDEETMMQLAFNELWHYALDTAATSDDATYISSKTLWNMRKIVINKGLDSVLFEKITAVLAQVFEVDVSQTAARFRPYQIEHAAPRPHQDLRRNDPRLSHQSQTAAQDPL